MALRGFVIERFNCIYVRICLAVSFWIGFVLSCMYPHTYLRTCAEHGVCAVICVFFKQLLPVKPYHDPLAKGALLMPQPSLAHQVSCYAHLYYIYWYTLCIILWINSHYSPCCCTWPCTVCTQSHLQYDTMTTQPEFLYLSLQPVSFLTHFIFFSVGEQSIVLTCG